MGNTGPGAWEPQLTFSLMDQYIPRSVHASADRHVTEHELLVCQHSAHCDSISPCLTESDTDRSHPWEQRVGATLELARGGGGKGWGKVL